MANRLKTFMAFIILLLTTVAISKCQAQDTTKFTYYALFLVSYGDSTVIVDTTLICEEVPATVIYDSIAGTVTTLFGFEVNIYKYKIVDYFEGQGNIMLIISEVGHRMVFLKDDEASGLGPVYIFQSPHTVLRLANFPFSCEEL